MRFRRGDFIPFSGVRKSLYSDHLLLVPIHYYYSTEIEGIDNRFNLLLRASRSGLPIRPGERKSLMGRDGQNMAITQGSCMTPWADHWK